MKSSRDSSCLTEIKKLLEYEASMEYQTIDEKFHVIDSDTVPAVVDPALAKAISFGKGDWKLLPEKGRFRAPVADQRLEFEGDCERRIPMDAAI